MNFRFAQLFLLAVLICTGCATSPRSASVESTARELPLPRDRRGCLPFPGLFTLYARADVARLGTHRYGDRTDAPAGNESERGIFYTTKAGFLDLAHLRMTIDWTRFCVSKIRDAIDAGQTQVSMNGSNGSMFHATLQYPDDWSALPPAERERLAFELALRTGERLAYLMLLWHEVATWYGDHTFVFDESPSAFTWDDVMSHVIGVRVAEMALRDRGRPFDEAVTLYLDAQLQALGAVGPEKTQQAVDAVDGVWWAGGRPLKRQLDTGLDTNSVYPWLVPGLPFANGEKPQPFAIPHVGTVIGRDLSDFCTVRIEPRIAAAQAMRRVLPDARPAWFGTDDLSDILVAMRTQMTEQFGLAVSEPWPARTPQGKLARGQTPGDAAP
ncbi:MAG TPA: DUF4056 domain-containing protein [Tepidisphaeraceae bacterium]